MTPLDRRAFLQSVSALAPVVAAGCSRGATSATTSVDEALLLAVATVVLPTELSTSGVEQVSRQFLTWLAAYRPSAELNHDYGSGEIRYAGAHPAAEWNAQLHSLDLEAQARYLSSFTDLSRDQRSELVVAALGNEHVTELPQPQDAHHVIVGLLAFYYRTPEAADRCYRAEIGTNRCRALDEVAREPKPMPPRA
jgi:hypothetical protein